MNYETYNAEDFLFDESFRQWIEGTSPQAITFWEQWLVQHPDRTDVVKQAQELVRALNDHYRDDAPTDRFTSELDCLMQRAAERRDAESETPILPIGQRYSWWRWGVAASIIITVGLSIWLYRHITPRAGHDSYAHLTKKAPLPLQEKVNTSTHVVNILLSDGTLVTLQPKSRLSYPKRFDTSDRTVYLNGEAFFDVVRNPAKPFLIYANQTVTKVLGTSFIVRAFEEEKDVIVTVRTGRVSVYKQQDFEKAQQSGLRRIQGIILTPNQQMTYNLEDSHLTKALVEKPTALMPEIPSREQVFEDAPVAKVFSTIERTYGVKLLYNEDDLSACLVNLTFSNESLLERLDVVCQTVGASYEVLDGQIVITSKGCK
ncbi:FecR family protein [Spirosoma flavum]|uniref:FecR family protein n=1 Tax=Spirosoma flavum TaxID=2048557 RepID=A0ABW6AHZ2_9BACT